MMDGQEDGGTDILSGKMTTYSAEAWWVKVGTISLTYNNRFENLFMPTVSVFLFSTPAFLINAFLSSFSFYWSTRPTYIQGR